MADYALGHVKRDPMTGSVAVRTVHPESDPFLAKRAWSVACPHQGPRDAPTDEVEGWDDLFTPPDWQVIREAMGPAG